MKAKITPSLEGFLDLELTAENFDETHSLEEIRGVLADNPTSFNAEMVPKRFGVQTLSITIKKAQ